MGRLELSNMLEGPWWHSFMATEDVAVGHIDLARQSSRLPDALEWLDETDLSRYHRFLYPEPAYRFALCRSAVRAILCGCLGCDNRELSFELTAYERPIALLAGEAVPVEFSVSHSVSHGLIAFAANCRVGVDVEERRPRRLGELIEIAMSPDERAFLEELEDTERQWQFFRFWTLKEAVLKAMGMGLYFDLSRVEVPVALRNGDTVAEFKLPGNEDSAWILEDIGGPEFAAALAREKS